jgi:hypothetical protein
MDSEQNVKEIGVGNRDLKGDKEVRKRESESERERERESPFLE